MEGEVEKKYFEKLNISVLSIDQIKKLIKQNIINTINCWNEGFDLKKQTFHIIGPAGVGKTQICKQIQEEISEILNIDFKYIKITSPVISRDDLMGPYPLPDQKTFEMFYTEFIPKEEDSFGIFVIDEFSRGDDNLQQLMWQIQNEYKIHLKEFPKGWFVICLDNPDDREYSMNSFEDAAGLRRTLHIYTDVNVQSFLNYAKEKKFHNSVIDWIIIHPNYLYDYDSQKLGSVYSNPGSWEEVSTILYGYELSGFNLIQNSEELLPLIAGKINLSHARLFIDFIKEGFDINPKDILEKYNDVRKYILNLIENNNYVKLSNIMQSFSIYTLTHRPEINDELINNIGMFLTDIPIDIATSFLSVIDTYGSASEEYKYFTKLHIKMKKLPLYMENYYQKLSNLKKEKL